METLILKRPLYLFFVLTLIACDKVTVVDVITLETDTYISSVDYSDHSESNQLKISKTATTEDRGIVKFPTGKTRDYKSNLDQTFATPLDILFFPFFITEIILGAILDCKNSVIRAENLTNSKLVLEVLGNTDGNSLSNRIQIRHLAKPWWQQADWEYSHRFSQNGRWSNPGADIDTSFTPISATHTGTTLEFDITTYFKSLISKTNTVHYGLLVSTIDPTIDPVTLASVQYSSSSARPKIVSTYTGSCVQGANSKTQQRVFYLSTPVSQ